MQFCFERKNVLHFDIIEETTVDSKIEIYAVNKIVKSDKTKEDKKENKKEDKKETNQNKEDKKEIEETNQNKEQNTKKK